MTAVEILLSPLAANSPKRATNVKIAKCQGFLGKTMHFADNGIAGFRKSLYYTLF